ncbi:hypothetical protein BC833DRAFT_586437, partial [Globomyces pollinis-pini]
MTSSSGTIKNDSELEVELGFKFFNLPGITKQSLQRLNELEYEKADPNIQQSFEKLSNYLSKRNRFKHDIVTSTTDNTDSYQKVQQLIFTNAHEYIITKQEMKSKQSEYNNLNTVKPHWLDSILNSDTFQISLLITIVFHCILIALQTDDTHVFSSYSAIELLTYFCFLIYISEIILRIYSGTAPFWKSKFILISIGLSVIEIVSRWLPFTHPLRFIGVLRIFRVLQPFKSRRYNSLLAGVRSIVSTINESVEDVVNITILVFAFTYFWANLGVVLYKNENPLDFGNVGAAYFTLFTAITQIGWIETFVQLRSKGFFISATIYFSTYFITVVFVISKIIVAVIVSNLEEFHKLAAESKRKRSRKLKSKKEALQGRIIRNLISMPGKDSKAWNSQVPFEVPDFDYISKVKVEHYATVLAIMEKNMEEYVQIVESLKEIQVEVKELNNAIEEKRVTEIQQLGRFVCVYFI